jgi:hypothetical protein
MSKAGFIAITTPGAEYLYKSGSMIKVPFSRGKEYAAAFTAAGYKLKAGEKWYFYQIENEYQLMDITETAKQRNGKIHIYSYYYKPAWL